MCLFLGSVSSNIILLYFYYVSAGCHVILRFTLTSAEIQGQRSCETHLQIQKAL